jgi:hypothetical protein
MNLLSYAHDHDPENKWFCMLTDSCVPIIPPQHFRNLFFQNYDHSIFRWKRAWWNVYLNNRANLRYLTGEFHLGHDPWFVLKREDALACVRFASSGNVMYKRVCDGGLANESVFAIILHGLKRLENVKNEISHVTDWEKMSSPTSPYIFQYGTAEDIQFINTFLHQNKYAMFLRKVNSSFPDEILNDFIRKPAPAKKWTLPASFVEWIIITRPLLILFWFWACFYFV